jgi:hypothetical protein
MIDTIKDSIISNRHILAKIFLGILIILNYI